MNGANSAQADWRGWLSAPGPRRVLAVGAAAALALALADAPAAAQPSQRPTITVASTITAEAAGQSALAINVGPPGAVPPRSFIRLRGLPPMAALSDGHAIAPGAWAVALTALPDLEITVPAGVSGRSEMVITLVAADGAVLAEAKSALVVSAARHTEKSEKSAAPRDLGPQPGASMLRAGAPLPSAPPAVAESSGPAPPARAQPTPPERERALRLLKKGEEQLAEGNIAAARLLYERAAEAGLAQGAMALAATFDPNELAKLQVRGIQADAKEARRWYERARQLGAADAEPRLSRLGAP